MAGPGLNGAGDKGTDSERVLAPHRDLVIHRVEDPVCRRELVMTSEVVQWGGWG